MEVWIANKERVDTMILPESSYLDIEVGSSTMNDFRAEIPLHDYDPDRVDTGGYVYVSGTEYGGMLLKMTEEDNLIVFEGITFREMLNRMYVEPPSGSSYKTLSGDLSSCVSQLLSGKLGTLFVYRNMSTSVNVTNHKVNRYVSVLEAITNLLDLYSYKLVITVDSSSETFIVRLSIEKVVDHSESIEVSQDSSLRFNITRSLPQYTHMLLLGKGELSDRVVAYLDWNYGKPREVSSIPYATGIFVYKYENTGSDDKSVLIVDGKKKFLEVNQTDSQEVDTTVDDDAYSIGDIIGGRSYITGIIVKEKVTKKIINIQNGMISITYKIGA